MKHNPGRPVWVIDSHVWGFSNAKSELSRQQLFSLFFCDSGQMNCRNTSNLPRMCACKQRLAGGHWCGKSCASLNFSCRMHLFAKTLCITWHRDGCCVNAHLLPIAMHKGSCISSCTAFACLTTVLESSKTNWGRERVYHFPSLGTSESWVGDGMGGIGTGSLGIWYNVWDLLTPLQHHVSTSEHDITSGSVLQTPLACLLSILTCNQRCVASLFTCLVTPGGHGGSVGLSLWQHRDQRSGLREAGRDFCFRFNVLVICAVQSVVVVFYTNILLLKLTPLCKDIKTYWLSWVNWVSLGFGSYIEWLWWTVFFSIFWHSHACLQQHIGSIRVIKASNYFVSINAYTFSQASIIPGLDYIYSSKSVFLLNKKKSSKYISYSVETSTKMFQLFV